MRKISITLTFVLSLMLIVNISWCNIVTIKIPYASAQQGQNLTNELKNLTRAPSAAVNPAIQGQNLTAPVSPSVQEEILRNRASVENTRLATTTIETARLDAFTKQIQAFSSII